MSINYGKLLKKSRHALRMLSMKVLPQELANKVIRKQLNLNSVKARSELTLELASDTETLYEALSLVQKAFYRMGYTEDSNIRLTPYHLLPGTIVICVKHQAKVVATMTIIPDSAFGLPLEACYSIDEVLLPNQTVELSSLAVDPDFAGQRGEILYNLIKFMYHCNVDLLDVKMEVIGVNPSMVPLYRSIMLFKPIPGVEPVSYDFVNGAMVEPMYLDLRTAIDQYSKIYKGKPDKTNLMKFFLAAPPAHFLFPKKETIQNFSPQNRIDSLNEILSWRPNLLLEISTHKFQKLIELYKDNLECQELLKRKRGANE